MNHASYQFRFRGRVAMRPIFVWLFVVVVLVQISPKVCADQVDRYITGQLKKEKAPGLSLAVLRNGRVVKAKGYGLASVELNVPATPHTVYQLASVTKPFTAAAIMLLVEEGKVSLSDSITNYLESVPAAWSNITVRQLLTMSSGIKDYFAHVPSDAWLENYTHERIIGLVANLPLDFAPGEEFGYSNSNYVLLAMLIRKVSQKPYHRFVTERIFQPLSMSATRRDDPSVIVTNRAALYNWHSNTLITVPFLNPTLWNNGDGGLISTVIDLAKWDSALYENRVLSASNSEALWTPGKFNNGKQQLYGFGWNIGQQRGHRWVGHSGGRPGASTQVTRFVDDGLTVIVLMNGPGNASDMALHIAGMYLPGLTLGSIKPPRDPEPELTQRLKQCLIDLAEKGDSDVILPQFRQECAKSKSRVGEIRRRLANVKSFEYVATEKVLASADIRNVLTEVSRSCTYKLVNSEGTRFYVFELTPDNRVAWCHSVPD